jgi:hypothetical protein
VQPWRVHLINESEADLLVDSDRTLPKEDPTGSFIILTMGLFLEALTLLAANHEHRLDYEFFHEPDWYAQAILDAQSQTFLPFAHLKLTPDTSVRKPDYDPPLFRKRRTSRISYLDKPVPDEATVGLKQLAAEWDQRYDEITDPALIERILEQNTKALFHDLNSDDYHDEITSWFRFTNQSSLRHRDGLDFRCMNTSRSTYWLTARFPQLLKLPGARSLLAQTYRRQIGPVPTLGLLSGDFWAAASALKTGRFLMRFWLETARQNLYIHPYGNLVTNKDAAQWMEAETKIPKIWLVFKIGFSAEPPKSYRRSVEEILID